MVFVFGTKYLLLHTFNNNSTHVRTSPLPFHERFTDSLKRPFENQKIAPTDGRRLH